MPKCKQPLRPQYKFRRATLTRASVFCDFCDVYLTHDSMSVRKAHNSGRNHLRNVVDYYQRTPLPLSRFPPPSPNPPLI
jgi:hypothetical protein